MSKAFATTDEWPDLDWQVWRQSCETLWMFAQIVGKTRLGLTCLRNHWWNVPLYVTARGLSTSAMPLPDGELLEIEFDFLSHELQLRRSSGATRILPLAAQSVAEFYAAFRRALLDLDVGIQIDTLPVECKDPIPFVEDTVHRSYERDSVHRFWRSLRLVGTLFERFNSSFYGKISPVHFFWGSFDLAVTRFSGRRAPPRPGADRIQAEAYSHECISAGFWPGNGGYGQAAFYCYAAPVPPALDTVNYRGPGAYDKNLGEFVLNYNEARESNDPASMVLRFLEETYAACAEAAGWDRASLDRIDGAIARNTGR